jgi:hypothetical protein
LPAECDGSDPPTWQVTGALSGFSTQIKFNDVPVPVEQLAVTATLGHFGTPRLGWSVTAGGVVAGQIEGRDISGGGTAAGTLSWLPIYEGERRPFFALTGTFGTAFVRAPADDGMMHSWWANDFRGGLTVGKTLAGRWVPYASVRGFAGPVFWQRAGEAVTGGDRYHVTAGAGLIVRLPGSVDMTVEGMPLGERSAAFGLTLHL